MLTSDRSIRRGKWLKIRKFTKHIVLQSSRERLIRLCDFYQPPPFLAQNNMSDTKYSVVAARVVKKNIAIIDDDWIGDSLSDDGMNHLYLNDFALTHLMQYYRFFHNRNNDTKRIRSLS